MERLQERFAKAKDVWEKRTGKKFDRKMLISYTGASKGTVSQWFTAETQTISYEYSRKAADFLGVNEKWLQKGEGPMELSSDLLEKIEPPVTSLKTDDELLIRQYHEARGAMGSGAVLGDQPGLITSLRVNEEWVRKNVPYNSGLSNLAIVTGFGDSMKGMFDSGDPLLVDTGIKAVDYDAVYFFRVGNEGFIKRLQRIPGLGIKVLSKNPEYESWTITEDMDFEVFARVLIAWNSTKF